MTLVLVTIVAVSQAAAQSSPYDIAPSIEPPYHRVRHEGSQKPGELEFPVRYTLWVPPGAKTLGGVVVHQHGCGEGSCQSGLTGARDLHWQALAAEHDCASLRRFHGSGHHRDTVDPDHPTRGCIGVGSGDAKFNRQNVLTLRHRATQQHWRSGGDLACI